MPIRNLDAFFEPRSIGIMAESFAPGTYGGLALAAVASTNPKTPVVLIGPAPAGAPFPTVPSMAEVGHAPDLVLITLPTRDTPPILSNLGRRGTRAAIITQHDNYDPEVRRSLAPTAKDSGLRLLGPGSLGIQVIPTRADHH